MSGWRLRPDFQARVKSTADSLRARGFGAGVGVVLGSGLGNFVDQLETSNALEFGEIAGFHTTTVQAHKGRLVQGKTPGSQGELLVLQGRLHAYEGHPMEDVVFPIATLLELGVRTLVLTNAAGGLHPDHRAGDLMAITGLIDFHLADPLRGLMLPPEDVPVELSLRAATSRELFARELALRIVDVGAEAGIAVGHGVYISLWGPSYETPREIGFLRKLGAHAVGMSTGPEAAYAARMGAEVAGISCITNVAREVGVAEVSHAEVIEVGAARRQDMARLLLAFVESVLAA